MSSLRDKLQVLRGDRKTGAHDAQAAGTIAERVAHLRGLPSDRPRLDVAETVAAQTGGRVVAPHVVCIEERLSISVLHGSAHLQRICGALSSSLLPAPAERIIFLDTETTGLAGGTGTVAFLVGWIEVTPQAVTLHQYIITAFAGEAAMLEAVAKALEDTSTLVTFNGKTFDQPLLMTRFRLHGIECDAGRLRHADLLHPTRRAFSRRWPDCRLQTCENRLLAVRRHNDIPGHEIPMVWFDLLRSGTTGALVQVIAHNRVDLLSLAMLLPALDAVFYDPQGYAADVAAVARYWHARDEPARAIELLARQSNMTDAERIDLARWYRQMDDWNAAVELWEQGAVRHCCESLLNLAKYREHRQHDYTAAMHMVDRLLYVDANNEEYRRRYERLQRKIAAKNMPEETVDASDLNKEG